MALQKKFIVTNSDKLTEALAYTQSIVFDESRQSIWARDKQGTMIQYSSYAYSTELGAAIDQLKTTLSGTSYQFTVTGNPAEGTAYITHTGTTVGGVTTYTMNVGGVVDAVGAVDSYAHTVGGELATLSGEVVKTVTVDNDSSSYLVATPSTNAVTLSAAQGLKNAVAQVTTWQGSGEGSISYQIAYAVDTLVDGAPETFDTLKEIADWIKTDEEGATALAEKVAENTEALAVLNNPSNTYTGSIAKSIKDAIDALDGTATGNDKGVAITVSEADGVLSDTATVTVTGATVAYNTSTGALAVTANSSYVLVGSAIEEIVKYVDAKAAAAVVIAEHTEDATNLGTYVAVTTENGSVKTVDVVVTPGTFATSTASGVAQAADGAGLATVADVATAVNSYVNLAISSLDASGSYTGSYISYSYAEEDGKITSISVSVDNLVDEINAKELVTASALNNINSKIGADYDISKGTIRERLDEIESDIAAVDLSYTYVTTTDTNHIMITPASDGNDLTYTINANVTNLTVTNTSLTGTAGLADTADVAAKVTSYVTNVIASLDANITNASGKDTKQFVTVGGSITEVDGKITAATNTVTVDYGTLGVTENASDAEPFTSTDGIAYVSDVASALNDYFSWGTV